MWQQVLRSSEGQLRHSWFYCCAQQKHSTTKWEVPQYQSFTFILAVIPFRVALQWPGCPKTLLRRELYDLTSGGISTLQLGFRSQASCLPRWTGHDTRHRRWSFPLHGGGCTFVTRCDSYPIASVSSAWHAMAKAWEVFCWRVTDSWCSQ